MSSLLYVLDGHEAVSCPDPVMWARWFEAADLARRVALTDVGARSVSTVFIGIDHQHNPGGPPILFETMVFSEANDIEETQRYSTWEEAESGHQAVVSRLRGKRPK